MSSTTISILTPVDPLRADHLLQTAQSIRVAREALARIGMELEWVVVIDGPGIAPDVTQVTPANVLRRPMKGGVSEARNTALARASGTWVMPLDHDDLLDASGLVKLFSDSRALAASWVAGTRLYIDGSSTTKHGVTNAQEWRPRQLEETWQVPFPFHPNVLIARREVALAVGGWPALTGVQDLGYALNLNRQFTGWSLPIPLTRLRRWAKQTVAQPFWLELKAEDFSFLAAHINAERAMSGLQPVRAPNPLEARPGKPSVGGINPSADIGR
jgi:hypothetical protein